MKLLTFNVGSYTKRRAAVLALLADHLPHVCCLQECSLTNGQQHILRQDLQSLGYYPLVGSKGLCTVVRDGCNVAPTATLPHDQDFRIQRLALQLGEHRVLLRHRHAHSGSAAERRRFDDNLLAENGNLTIDIGDFNERPAQVDADSYAVVFPDCPTYRLNPAMDSW